MNACLTVGCNLLVLPSTSKLIEIFLGVLVSGIFLSFLIIKRVDGKQI